MDRRVLWAIVHIDTALAAADLAALAGTVNLSPSRFAHLFGRDTGVSPSRYVHALRMERARALLERTFLTVKEVMVQVGVSDASHFSKDFRRYHGVSPSAVRRTGVAPPATRFMSAHLEYLRLADGTAAPAPGSAKRR